MRKLRNRIIVNTILFSFLLYIHANGIHSMNSQSKCGRKKNCAITGPHYHFTPQIEPIVEWNNCRTKWMRSGDKNLSQLWLLQQCTHKSQIIIKKKKKKNRPVKIKINGKSHTHTKKIETKTAYKVSFFLSLFSYVHIEFHFDYEPREVFSRQMSTIENVFVYYALWQKFWTLQFVFFLLFVRFFLHLLLSSKWENELHFVYESFFFFSCWIVWERDR